MLVGYAGLLPGPVTAATFTVNSTVDEIDALPGDGVCSIIGGDCTLRAAIQESNALPGADSISLPAGTYTLTIAGTDEDAAATGDLDITDDLEIDGVGATIDGNTLDRVFDVFPADVTIAGIGIQGSANVFRGVPLRNSGGSLRVVDGTVAGGAEQSAVSNLSGTLTLENTRVTGSGGTGASCGGAIENSSVLLMLNSMITNSRARSGGGLCNRGEATLTNTSISGCLAHDLGFGGGIFNSGTLSLDGCRVRGNRAHGFSRGGGIYNSGGVVTITDSVIEHNNADEFAGGGIYNELGTVALAQTSVISNMAHITGAGFYNTDQLRLENVTVANNSVETSSGPALVSLNGGRTELINVTIANNQCASLYGTEDFPCNAGISVTSDSFVSLANTLIAGNVDNLGREWDCAGTLNSDGYNLIQDISGCAITGDTTGNITGVDPLLGPLTDNGGPTATLALLPGSPAINSGNPAPPGSGGSACEASDQRSIPRPQAVCDIGAYEAVVCGDGTAGPGEICDDGNTLDGDCCSSSCQYEPNDNACTSDFEVCTRDVCNATGTCTHQPGNAGTICRPAVGICDVEESCNGVIPVCPPDAVAGTNITCRPAVDLCDRAEQCDSVGTTCPADLPQPSGTVCRLAAGLCDLTETCDGMSTACPADAKSTAACRSAVGPCDLAESCDGVANACPPDAKQTDGTPCPDGAFCNGAEQCQGGVCQSGAPPCTLLCNEGGDTCETGCLPAPLACRTAEKSLLLVRDKLFDGSDRLVWRWSNGEPTTQTEFGDPTDTADYTLCLYAGPTSALVGQSIIPAGAIKWSAVSTKGYKYGDAAAAEGGITKVLLKGSDHNKSKALLKGKGAHLPDLPLPVTAPVTVQLVNGDNGLCWSADYSGAELQTNEAGQLKAKTP